MSRDMSYQVQLDLPDLLHRQLDLRRNRSRNRSRNRNRNRSRSRSRSRSCSLGRCHFPY